MKQLIIFNLLLLLILAGCSGEKQNPVSDGIPGQDDLSISMDVDTTGSHNIAGLWRLEFDPEDLKITVMQDRITSFHFNATPFLNAPQFTVVSYNPLNGILDVDAKITNTSQFNGFDLRLIIYTNDYGVRLINEDNWIGMWDIPGGAVINPFKSYAKQEPGRIFFSGDSHTERLKLYFPSGYTSVDFAIDVSWPGNCEEPYEMFDFTQEILRSTPGFESEIEIKIHDWNGSLSEVNIYCPEITGEAKTPFHTLGSGWAKCTLVNLCATKPGIYTGYIEAKSTDSGNIALYDIVQISVTYGGNHSYGWTKNWFRRVDSLPHVRPRGSAIGVDGSIYVSGTFDGTADFEPGDGEDILTSSVPAYFLTKFDTEGNYYWTVQWGPATGLITKDIFEVCVNSQGYVYIMAYFQDEVDFDPGPGAEIHDSSDSRGVFISEFDTNGNFLWVRTWENVSNLNIRDLELDSQDKINFGGCFRYTVDFDPGPGEFEMTAPLNNTNAYLVKLNGFGNFEYALNWGSEDEEELQAITSDNSGNVYAGGSFENEIDLDPGPGEDFRINDTNKQQIVFLLKLDLDGNYLWGKHWDASYFTDLHTDLNLLYTTGQFWDSADFDPGPGVDMRYDGYGDKFLSRFDTSGNYHFVNTWGGYAATSDSICTDPAGSVYVHGTFDIYCDFAPGVEEDTRRAEDYTDMYISKFDADGDYINVYQISIDPGDVRRMLLIDQPGNLYIINCFSGEFDFDFGPGEDILSTNDGFIFMSKWLY